MARAVVPGGICVLSLVFFLASLGTLRSTHYGIGGDEVSYFALAEGKVGETSPPYRCRVLVPMVASLLPWSIPEDGWSAELWNIGGRDRKNSFDFTGSRLLDALAGLAQSSEDQRY